MYVDEALYQAIRAPRILEDEPILLRALITRPGGRRGERSVMTREEIAAGLTALVQQLANGESQIPAAGWDPHRWAYVKGIASGEILRLRDRLVAAA